MNFENMKQYILEHKKEHMNEKIGEYWFGGAGEKAVKLSGSVPEDDVFLTWDEIEAQEYGLAKKVVAHFSENSSEKSNKEKLSEVLGTPVVIKEGTITSPTTTVEIDEKTYDVLETDEGIAFASLQEEIDLSITPKEEKQSEDISEEVKYVEKYEDRKNMLKTIKEGGEISLHDEQTFLDLKHTGLVKGFYNDYTITEKGEKVYEELFSSKTSSNNIKGDNMEIEVKISHKNEEINCCVAIEENMIPYYVFVENNLIRDYIEELTVSDSFKEALEATDIIKTVIEAIPYEKYINGLKIEFELKEFQKSLKENNLWKEWVKLKEFYGSDVELLEKKLLTSEKILKEYREVYGEEIA